MPVKDFIGREIQVGDFCAYPGSGNSSAEYGQILLKVTGLVEEGRGKVKGQRLSVRYDHNNDHKAIIKSRIVTISNPNKLVVIDPSPSVKNIFMDYAEGIGHKKFSPRDVGLWIHGQKNPFHRC